jgi:glutamate 5-kinase
VKRLCCRTYRRIVIKIGSALLVDRNHGLRRTWLESLADDLYQLQQQHVQPILVSSGAIALGRNLLARRHPELNLGRSSALTLEESQAAASVGQIELSRAYSEVLNSRNVASGQILLTIEDTRQRQRYLNARATVSKLLDWHAVPVINENDTVATSEIRYGDNDRLAARVASMMNADLLVLLSDVDGLYTQPPPETPSESFVAQHFVPQVETIDDAIVAMAGEASSPHGTGGMKTKIEAGRIATAAGTAMVISSGKSYHPIRNLMAGAPATWFAASANPISDRKKWIGGQLKPAGKVHIDAGAARAIRAGNSLLCSGVASIEGQFQRGDTVAIHCEDLEIGRGLIGYASADADSVKGLSSNQIADVLGAGRRTELIHRDDMVLHHLE